MKNATPLPFALQRRTARPSTQRGITTVQIAIGILVSIIALVGSFGGFQYVAQAKVNTDINILADLKTATVRYGSSLGNGGFTAGNSAMAVLNNLGFFASTGLTVGGSATEPTVKNQYQGAVTVLPAVVADIDPGTEGLTFTFADLPSAACRDLALRIDNLAHAIKATPAKTGNASTVKALGKAMDPVAAATGCAGSGNVNQLAVTFSRT